MRVSPRARPVGRTGKFPVRIHAPVVSTVLQRTMRLRPSGHALQNLACDGRYQRSQPRVTLIIATGMAMTPLNAASQAIPLARISGTKIKTKAMQTVIRPTLAVPVNIPTRMLSQRPREPSPPKTAMPTGSRNANPKTTINAMYNTARFWPSHPQSNGAAQPCSKWRGPDILNSNPPKR